MLGAATQGSCTKSQVGFPFWVQERYETHGKYSWKIGKSAQKVCPNQEIIFQAGVCLGMVGIPTRMPWSLKSLKSFVVSKAWLFKALGSLWCEPTAIGRWRIWRIRRIWGPISAGRWFPVLGIGLVGIPTFKHGQSRSNRCRKYEERARNPGNFVPKRIHQGICRCQNVRESSFGYTLEFPSYHLRFGKYLTPNSGCKPFRTSCSQLFTYIPCENISLFNKSLVLDSYDMIGWGELSISGRRGWSRGRGPRGPRGPRWRGRRCQGWPGLLQIFMGKIWNYHDFTMIIWLVVWNMAFIFPFIGNNPSQLTNSYFSRWAHCTTNQMISPWLLWGQYELMRTLF